MLPSHKISQSSNIINPVEKIPIYLWNSYSCRSTTQRITAYHCYKLLFAKIKAVWCTWSFSPAFDLHADPLITMLQVTELERGVQREYLPYNYKNHGNQNQNHLKLPIM